MVALPPDRTCQCLINRYVIENSRQHASIFYFNVARLGFPMNASGYTTT